MQLPTFCKVDLALRFTQLLTPQSTRMGPALLWHLLKSIVYSICQVLPWRWATVSRYHCTARHTLCIKLPMQFPTKSNISYCSPSFIMTMLLYDGDIYSGSWRWLSIRLVCSLGIFTFEWKGTSRWHFLFSSLDCSLLPFTGTGFNSHLLGQGRE